MNESKKEKLPIDFITQFVSTSWNEIGNLTASKDAIKKEFTGTDKIEKIMQDLIDSYLICVGQMETFLDKKNYLDIPDENELKEALNEDVLVDVQLKDEKDVNVEDLKDKVTDLLADAEEISDKSEANVIIRDVEELEDPLADEKIKETSEPFEYFVDFDEPEPDADADTATRNAIILNK